MKSIMFSSRLNWSSCGIILCYLILTISAQAPGDSNPSSANGQKDPINIDTPSIPVHYDTSRDLEGKDHDSEPFRNNGRGSHEANQQNLAAETNGTHGQPIEEFQQDVLDQINQYRRPMCANNLQTDENLHQIAQRIANDKANEKETTMSNDYNEIVYVLDTGDPSKVTPENIVKAWFDENKHYSADNEPSATNFSQLVWKGSTRVGIGHAYSSHILYVIAVFQPPGNIHGQFTANVGCGANGQLQGSR